MGVFNKFTVPDVDEEKARMQALVEAFKDNNEDEETEDEEEMENPIVQREVRKIKALQEYHNE